jgi:hypothetical protein
MATCRSCASEVPDRSRFCLSCGAAIEIPTSAPTETSLKNEPAAVSHPSLDEARFIPGTILARRYRIVGLLGRGGMGEVYRADDLKLGQPVALKFLPQAVQRDQARLDRFLNEVRTALKVSHPNVCRVHDIGEVEGQHYLSMEYVDGEDLASLLRRIERLPQNKAVQIARQLCAGLATAHDQGILHRDLKPANVMIDGQGRAKITDFGLAGLAEGIEGDEVRAGTPQYMSPEQHAGKEVTVRSDIYSLGLVLYELFTGKRAFEASTPGEMARRQGGSTPTSPSSHVEGLDQVVERVILRCLDLNPSLRPPTALAVAAALPGGDPLAAALAAGETPPPELVADAGEVGGLKPWVAWICLLGSIVGVLLGIHLAGMYQLGRMVPPGKAPQLLAEKAREIVLALGYDVPPRDSVYGYEANQPYLDHLEKTDPSPGLRERLAVGQPPGLWYWYRQSPGHLAPRLGGNVNVVAHDPPASSPGMLETRLDPQGRLRRLEVVPPERDDAAETEAEPAWTVLFDAAGFKIDEFTAVEARWAPRVFADRRAAWEGTYPDDPDTAIRVEAAAYHGRPVSFRIFEPWTPVASGAAPEETLAELLLSRSYNVFVLGILFGGALIAWRNLRAGRGDRKGAWRLAFYLLCVRLLVWMFGVDDLLEPSAMETFMSHLAWALYRFGVVWLFYIAFEPYLRRIWPGTMVSWVRLLRGRFKDPLVGRDVLIGVLVCAVLLVVLPAIVLAGGWLGAAPQPPSPDDTTLEALRGSPHAVAMMLFEHSQALLRPGMFGIVFLLLMRLLLRRTWLAVGPFLLILAVVNVATGDTGGMVGWSIWAVFVAAWLLLFFRAGLLSLFVYLGTIGLWGPLTLSLDPGSWYSSGTYIALLLTLGMAAYGFYVSLSGRPIFGDALLDKPRGDRT